MISKIELNGFKSFIADGIDLGNLTLLTGINNSGKSSVIQAVRMLEKASKGEEPLLQGHGAASDLINRFTNAFNISLWQDIIRLIVLNYEKVGGIDFEQAPDWVFPELIHISADRFGPSSTVPIFVGDNYKIGSRGENIFKCIESYDNNAVNVPDPVIHENAEGSTFMYNLEAWLGVISPNPNFKPNVQLQSDTSYATFGGKRSHNVGFGLSYALPVITALLLGTVEKNTLVMIENPEAHLHPKGQAEIARLIARCVEAGAQIIIETHSDHLFDGIRIQAKESDNSFHEKIKTYWFELDEKGNTLVEDVNIDHNGRIDNSPQGLFDQFELNARALL